MSRCATRTGSSAGRPAKPSPDGRQPAPPTALAIASRSQIRRECPALGDPRDSRERALRIPVKLDLALIAVRIVLVAALLPFAIGWRTPLFASWRYVALAVLLALPLALIAPRSGRCGARPARALRAHLSSASLALALLAFAATAAIESNSSQAPRRACGRSATARKARPPCAGRLSQPGDLAGADRAPRHRGHVPQRAQRRGQAAGRDPPGDRRAAGDPPPARASRRCGSRPTRRAARSRGCRRRSPACRRSPTSWRCIATTPSGCSRSGNTRRGRGATLRHSASISTSRRWST